MAPRRNDVEYFRNVEGYFCLSIYCTVRAANRRHTPGSPTPACACILLPQSQQFSAIIRQDLTVAKCPFFVQCQVGAVMSCRKEESKLMQF